VPEQSVTQPAASTAVARRSAPLIALLFVVALAGCGVGASSTPVDEGDAVTIGTTATDTEKKDPPSPDAASSPEGLVQDFLMAASGGLAAASGQVKAFLTDNAQLAWQEPVNPENPALAIVRVVSGPTIGAAVAGRTPVTVGYQMVGTLKDLGRIEDLDDLATVRTMTFWVVPDVRNPSNRRVDEISGAPAGLFLSDQALTTYYRVQPIYFWDPAYTALVPDLRYVPLTITADQRATRVVQYIQAGPSPWLSAAQRLPAGTISSENVQSTDNGTLVVKLSPQAASGGQDALRRLKFQLQWSLRTNSTPRVALSIDDTIQEVAASEQEYLQYNLSNIYEKAPQRYDITADQKVVPVPAVLQLPPVLAAPENINVVSAAIGRGGALAAFVSTVNNGRRLQIVREGVSGKLDVNLPQSSSLGRPAFVPGADVLLIATGGQFGRLWRVSTTDGSAVDVTPFNLSGVSEVSVSPDGRRVALIADGQAYVSSLSVANNTVTVGSNPRPILANQLIPATAVAWTDEAWLYVAGMSGGAPAMWRVTADSVVAENVSESLRGLRVDDLVAYPKGPGPGSADVLAYTQSGIYTYFRQLTPPEQSVRFFGTP
jgi:Lipoprotein LpqB beta-propeller domain